MILVTCLGRRIHERVTTKKVTKVPGTSKIGIGGLPMVIIHIKYSEVWNGTSSTSEKKQAQEKMMQIHEKQTRNACLIMEGGPLLPTKRRMILSTRSTRSARSSRNTRRNFVPELPVSIEHEGQFTDDSAPEEHQG